MKKIFHEKEFKESKHYSKKVAMTILSVISVLSVVLAVLGAIWIKQKFDETGTNLLRDWAAEHPVLGALVMVGVTAVQVVIAFIPGELVEIAAGYIFGAWLGLLLCLVGMAIGSTVAILLARHFGRKLVASLYSEEKLDSLPILNDPKKRNATTALLFLIPGTPKDLITYLVGLTKMSIPQYLAISLVCRIPSVVMSTISGGALGDNRIKFALWFFIITGIVSAAGYLLYLFLQKRQKEE